MAPRSGAYRHSRPIRIPSDPTEHEPASSVWVLCWVQSVDRSFLQHMVLEPAMAALSTAGSDRPMLTPPASFIEESTSTSTKQQLSPGQIRAKTEAILRKSKSSLKSMEKGSATHRLPTTARTETASGLMQEEQDKEASEDASASPTTMRFSESAAKVESTAQSLLAKVAEHSRKGADALALAANWRRHALDVAQHGKLLWTLGSPDFAEVAERQDLASNPCYGNGEKQRHPCGTGRRAKVITAWGSSADPW